MTWLSRQRQSTARTALSRAKKSESAKEIGWCRGLKNDGQERAEGQGVHAALSGDEGDEEGLAGDDGVRAAERGDEDQGDADAHHAAIGAEPDDHRPEEIKMLLDGERPEMAERDLLVIQRGKAAVADEIIRAVEPVPRPGVAQGVEVFPGWDGRKADRDQDQHEIVEWENSQGAAEIEISEVSPGGSGSQEDSGDEITGEDEEQIDADRHLAGDGLENLGETIVVGAFG